MKLNSAVKLVGALLAGAAIGFALATALIFKNTANSPQFFGALAASLVAAAGLVFTTFYNDFSVRNREFEARNREKTAAAIDLHFWLSHCVAELDFISGALDLLHLKLTSENKGAIDYHLDQFKEVLSSHFYGELLERAKSSSILPPEIAGYVAEKLYETYTTADRNLAMRHASPGFVPTTDQVAQYAKLISMQKERLQRANSLLGEYLIEIHALPKFSD
ncbi:MAG: hypothetical protein JO256_10185 [Alphaproteobacteria bacterium]|nr:hypothetical protein [Alphaproteobacteria bacterium]